MVFEGGSKDLDLLVVGKSEKSDSRDTRGLVSPNSKGCARKKRWWRGPFFTRSIDKRKTPVRGMMNKCTRLTPYLFPGCCSCLDRDFPPSAIAATLQSRAGVAFNPPGGQGSSGSRDSGPQQRRILAGRRRYEQARPSYVVMVSNGCLAGNGGHVRHFPSNENRFIKRCSKVTWWVGQGHTSPISRPTHEFPMPGRLLRHPFWQTGTTHGGGRTKDEGDVIADHTGEKDPATLHTGGREKVKERRQNRNAVLISVRQSSPYLNG